MAECDACLGVRVHTASSRSNPRPRESGRGALALGEDSGPRRGKRGDFERGSQVSTGEPV